MRAEDYPGGLSVHSQLRLLVPPVAKVSRAVRERVLGYLEALGIRREDEIDFVTAVGEALANAIEHSGTREPVEVWVRIEDEALVAEVTDRGFGFARHEDGAPALPSELLAERGRGFAIMRRFTDGCTIRSVPGEGTVVRLVRRLRTGGPPFSFVPAHRTQSAGYLER